MAKPRIFVSSTFYDLKHIRSSLEVFIDSLGYEPILSERGAITYSPDVGLDESCYRDAAAADLFVLIIGGRYGSPSSRNEENDRKRDDDFASITRKEFESAHDAGVPAYILIESGVNAEYQTYKKNKGNDNIDYAHVDSVNVFRFLDQIYGKTLNNPVFAFERSTEIQGWLRDQWAGLFREMLTNKSQNKNFSQLSVQINNLEAINATLKSYLESIIGKVSPDEAQELISSQDKKLKKSFAESTARENHWFLFMRDRLKGEMELEPTEEKIFDTIRELKSYRDIKSIFEREFGESSERIAKTLSSSNSAQKDFNDLREALGLPAIEFPKRNRLKDKNEDESDI